MGCVQSAAKVEEPGDTSSIKPEPLAVVRGPTISDSEKPTKPGQADAQPQAAIREVGPAEADVRPMQSRSMLVVWRQPVMPLDEQQRWETLCQLQILDTEPELAYDSITRLCLQVFKMSVACVTFFERDRVFLKSVVGLTGTEVSRNCSICSWTALSRSPQVLVVPDLREDARFSRYPIVTESPHARSYAGAPLVAANGIRMGTLCVLDTKPRAFTEADLKLLAQLATLVIKEVERRAGVNDAFGGTILPVYQPRRQSFAGDAAQDSRAFMLCDVSSPKWPILFANAAMEAHTGLSGGLAQGANFWELFAPLAARQIQACTLATEQGRPFQLRVRCCAAEQPSLSCSDGGLVSGGTEGCSGSSSGKARSMQLHFWSMGGSKDSPLRDAAAIGIPAMLQGDLEPGSSGRYYWASVVTDDVAAGDQRVSRGRELPLLVSASSSTGSGQQDVTGSEQGHVVGSKQESCGHNSCEVCDLCAAQDVRPSFGSVRVPASSAGDQLSKQLGKSRPHSDAVGHEDSAYGTSFVLLPEAQDQFSDIQLGGLLGRGAYGAVYKGKWQDTLVAVKVIDIAMRDQNPHAALEPLLHTRLQHPNIVKLYGVSTRDVELCGAGDLCSSDGSTHLQQEVWMIMEFCARGTLSDGIARGALAQLGPDGARMFGTINMRRLVTTLREIASAMAYLHEQNVLHGDLTGNNVMLVTDRTQRKGFAAKVGDFGLSRLIDPDEQRINTNTHGTITHMAPEVLMSGTHSRKADVYSFGIIMLEAYTGENQFEGMHHAQVVQHVVSGHPFAIPKEAPADLKALMQATLSHNPDDRPSFTQIHKQLCSMEAAIKQADAAGKQADAAPQKPDMGHSLQLQRSQDGSVEAPQTPAQQAHTTQFGPTTEAEAGFDTVQGLVTEVAAGFAAGQEKGAADVQSF